MSSTKAGEASGTRGSAAPAAQRASRELGEAIRLALRDYPDFPRPGILFRDIAPVLGDPALMREVILTMAAATRRAGARAVAGIESRGFLFGIPVSLELQLPFVPIRKGGKLPGETLAAEYELEYGSAHLEVQRYGIRPGRPVMLIDDLLATGGTASAAAGLIEGLGGEVAGIAFLVELATLEGRKALDKYDVLSLLTL